MNNIFWKGYSNNERHSTIRQIQRAVSAYGDVVDFILFSDFSISMTIEIVEANLDGLYDELRNIIGLEKSEHLHSVSQKERTLYLNITFTNATGNLKMEIPSVPG